ncbi:poly-gamma-glutamate hydrolase family protein [Trichococcus sp.]|uniref:poly-gamma-glutamate hydrolase family protein n=1 Tax=Trichococcus sp. TaxID=1985464 RepID=UPI003C799BA3
MKKFLGLIAMSGLLVIALFPGNDYSDIETENGGSYEDYSELADERAEGVDYEIISRKTDSDLAVIAIHGGSIEPGTSELADAIAGDDYDFYTFYGIMGSDNLSLRITSTNFDEPIARALVQESDRTLSIHGFAGSSELTYVGGRDKELVAQLKKGLTAAGFEVADAPMKLAATDDWNICNNNTRKAGAQIEISSSQRLKLFESLDEAGRETTTSAFEAYTTAIETSLAAH